VIKIAKLASFSLTYIICYIFIEQAVGADEINILFTNSPGNGEGQNSKVGKY
jgi:hypothetical protein